MTHNKKNLVAHRGATFIVLLILTLALAACQSSNPDHYSESNGEPVQWDLGATLSPLRQVVSLQIGDSVHGVPTRQDLVLHFNPFPTTATLVALPYTLTFAEGDTQQGTWYVQVRPQPLAPISTRLNDWAMKGSHNSYHVKPALIFHDSHAYTHPPLYQQLANYNVRTFELDIHQNPLNDQFEVYHIAAIDPVSSCYRLTRCLQEMRTWSDHNPLHTPVFVWLEIKDFTGGKRIDELSGLEAELTAQLGDKLYRPDDLQGSYASIQARLQAEGGWPAVSELQGKFVFILLNPDRYLDDYTAGYQHLQQRVLFPNTPKDHFQAPWAALTKLGLSDSQRIADAKAQHLLMATNLCGAPVDPERCRDSLAQGVAAGINMLKTDAVTIDLPAL